MSFNTSRDLPSSPEPDSARSLLPNFITFSRSLFGDGTDIPEVASCVNTFEADEAAGLPIEGRGEMIAGGKAYGAPVATEKGCSCRGVEVGEGGEGLDNRRACVAMAFSCRLWSSKT